MPRWTLVSVVAAVGALAQVTGPNTIGGRVSDPKGEPIAGAKVIVQQSDGSFRRETRTNSTGQYLFPPAPTGTYRISVEAGGFVGAKASGLKLDVATPLVQDFQLEIGPVTTLVEVKAAVDPMLQTSDSSIGSTIGGRMIRRLPIYSRDAFELLYYQPGIQPLGESTGARNDQNSFVIDGGDVSDLSVGFWVVPMPAESVEEFRAVVANPTASSGAGAGAHFHLQTRRGSNEFHGSAYWYAQREALNANYWHNNRLGIARQPSRENRFGASFGGPLWQNRTHFFLNYEGWRQRFPITLTSVVPSETLRLGVLRFRDAGGAVQTVDPKDYDPRGLGANPAALQVLRQYPPGNDPSAALADGLNTTGFTFTISRPSASEFGLLRLDHDLDGNWRLEASGRFYNFERLLPRYQSDLRTQRALERGFTRDRYVTVAVSGVLSPRLIGRWQFGYLRSGSGLFPGASTVVSPLDLGADFGSNLLGELGWRASPPWSSGATDYLLPSGLLHWQTRAHGIQAGFSLRHVMNSRFERFLPYGSVGAAQRVGVPVQQRPSFLRPPDVRRYNVLYSTLLGIVDSVSATAVRNARLEPLPLDAPRILNPSLRTWEFFVQDTWRAKPSFTLTYGLAYGWQTSPKERDGLQLIPVLEETGDLIAPREYLRIRQLTAGSGKAYNPEIVFQPVGNVGRDTTFDVDRSNFSPRVSAAWNPAFERGLLGAIFGRRRGVIRGGYGLLYDRTNLVTSVDFPIAGVGFDETLTISPRTEEGSPFRIGIDGPTPLPVPAPATAPIIPDGRFMTTSVDPRLRTPRNHVLNFSYQRELPDKTVVETAYVGRIGRRLHTAVNLNNFPYMFRDSASRQTFGEAFDALAAQLRANVPLGDVSPQPWFENMLPGGGTAYVASQQADAIISGDIGSVGYYFLNHELESPLQNPGVEIISFRTSAGRSNYHAGIFSANRRFSRGFQASASYTLSRSLDEVGVPQYDYRLAPNSFLLDAGYGPSDFDHRHRFSVLWLYEPPLGKGRRFMNGHGWMDKVVGGWFLSGIAQGNSGDPLAVLTSPQAFGGGAWSYGVGAIPLSRPTYDNAVHQSSGSGGVGTAGDPAAGGSGLNRFADPQAVFRNFRHISVSEDTRSGRGVLRGYFGWNLDVALGKMTTLTEAVRLGFSVECMNVMNRVNLAPPDLNLDNPTGFGVLSYQENLPRRIQAGARVEW